MSAEKTLRMLSTINAVDGFDPAALAVEYTDLNTGATRKRLPVMAQIAWFRLKYPDGRLSVTVQPTKDGFVATARVYMHYNDAAEFFISEATALADKPTASPREWAQTAAVGIALLGAGFGLQCSAAGEILDGLAFDELAGADEAPAVTPKFTPPEPAALKPAESAEPEPLTYEAALALPCPIEKYKGKTLGDLIMQDPRALTWIANKFAGNALLSEGARLICEEALKVTA